MVEAARREYFAIVSTRRINTTNAYTPLVSTRGISLHNAPPPMSRIHWRRRYERNLGDALACRRLGEAFENNLWGVLNTWWASTRMEMRRGSCCSKLMRGYFADFGRRAFSNGMILIWAAEFWGSNDQRPTAMKMSSAAGSRGYSRCKYRNRIWKWSIRARHCHQWLRFIGGVFLSKWSDGVPSACYNYTDSGRARIFW